MNNASGLIHSAFVFGFALIGAVGIPGVLLVFVQLVLGQQQGAPQGARLRPPR